MELLNVSIFDGLLLLILLKNVDYLISGLSNSKYSLNFFNNYKNIVSDNSDISALLVICNKIISFIENELKIVKGMNIEKDLETKMIKYYSKFIKWHY